MAKKRRPSRRELEQIEQEKRRMEKRRRKGAGSGKGSAGNRSNVKNTKNAQSPTSSQRRRKKKGMSLGTKIALALCTVLLILVLAAIGVLANKMSKLNTEDVDTDKLSISEELQLDQEGYLNVALFGLDTRENDVEMGTRSDTIMVASLNRKTKEIKLVSVFRDTLLQLSDGGSADLHKANSAYSYGEEEEAIAMLNRNLDLDIQKYVTVDFSALVDVINALGGVEIDVTEEEVDYINGYGAEITANTGVITDYVYNAGTQVLDGVQATAYCRIRYTSGDDFKRAERQRTVLMKVAEKAQQAGVGTINKIIDKVFPKVKTNFSLTEILAYAKDVKKYQFGDTMGFPVDKDTMSVDGEGDSVIPVTLESNVVELHQYLFGGEEAYEPTSTVKKISEMIENATGFTGTDSVTDTGTYSDSGYTDETGYADPGYTQEYGYTENYDYTEESGTADYGMTDYGTGMTDGGGMTENAGTGQQGEIYY